MSEVATILQKYPADCQATAVEALGNCGGLSGAQFWRFVAPRGALGLRCWPIEHPTPERLAFIHAVLRHAASRGLDFLPLPIATCRRETVVEHEGRLWELTPWLSGAADYESFPTAGKLRAAMIALAKFHIAVSDFPDASRVAPAPAVLQRLRRLHELQSGGITELASTIDDCLWPDITPLAHRFVAKLSRVVPATIVQLSPLADVALPLQICIRDVWCDNVLFTGDKVTGLVDFGAIDIDTPATDVARLLGSLAESDAARWQVGLDAYMSVSALSQEEIRVAAALDRAGVILGGCNWLRWLYVERRTFENADRVRRRLTRFAERLNAFEN